MRRRALIFLFAVGTIAGYGSGFAHLARWHHSGAEGGCQSWRSRDLGPAQWTPPPPAPAAAPVAPASPGPG